MLNSTKTWDDKKIPTEAQLKYWESMKGKTGEGTPRWKGKSASKSAKHQYLYKHYGSPKMCENKDCQGKSDIYEWCLKTGREYSHNREDYLRLCRCCHRQYDLTPEKIEQAVKNLYWFTNKIRISKYGKVFNWEKKVDGGV